MIVYLARHGESATPGRVLGQSDPGLSETGRRQSRSLAARMEELGPTAVWSSGLRRSIESASIVAEACGVPTRADSRLNEVSYGEWDGLSWAEIEARDPQTARRKSENWWAVTPPGGEEPKALLERVRQAWLGIDGPGPVLIVAHAAVNALINELAHAELAHAVDVDWVRALEFRQGYGEFASLNSR